MVIENYTMKNYIWVLYITKDTASLLKFENGEIDMPRNMRLNILRKSLIDGFGNKKSSELIPKNAIEIKSIELPQ